MKPCLAVFLIPIFFVGCCASRPFDPFAPYGTQCIAPPPTGSIGYGSGYYQPPPTATAPVGQGLQPVPSLSSQPDGPRTSSVPREEDWESARKPDSSFGASTNPVRPQVNSEPVRAMPRNVRPSENLAWVPPFRSAPSSHAQVAAQTPLDSPRQRSYLPPIRCRAGIIQRQLHSLDGSSLCQSGAARFRSPGGGKSAVATPIRGGLAWQCGV